MTEPDRNCPDFANIRRTILVQDMLLRWGLRVVFKALVPGRFKLCFRYVNFKLILIIDGWGISCIMSLISTPPDLIDSNSTLARVMVWCHQATGQYLSQRIYMSPYGVSRPQWVLNKPTPCLQETDSINLIHKSLRLLDSRSPKPWSLVKDMLWYILWNILLVITVQVCVVKSSKFYEDWQ